MTQLAIVALGLLISGMVPNQGVAVAPPPREVPQKLVNSRPIQYIGHVVAVDGQSITIRGSEGGRPNDEMVVRRFPAGAHLAAGEQDPDERLSSDYRLTDIKVGDKVGIRIHQIGPDDVCVSVSIRRRPGGWIPPAPWDNLDPNNRYHDWANAMQLFEEKGIPLPAKYDPVIKQLQHEAMMQELKKVRKRLFWELEHTAPAPRVVTSPRSAG